MAHETDPIYIAGWAMLTRAVAAKGEPTEIGGYHSAYNNLRNTLTAWYNDATPPAGGWAAATTAWTNALSGYLTGYTAVTPPPTVITPPPVSTTVTPTPGGPIVSTSLGGLLDGKIFGIDKKIIALGALAYFVFGKK